VIYIIAFLTMTSSCDQTKCNITNEANYNALFGDERRSDAITAPSDLRSGCTKINIVGNIGVCNTSELTSPMREISIFGAQRGAAFDYSRYKKGRNCNENDDEYDIEPSDIESLTSHYSNPLSSKHTSSRSNNNEMNAGRYHMTLRSQNKTIPYQLKRDDMSNYRDTNPITVHGKYHTDSDSNILSDTVTELI